MSYDHLPRKSLLRNLVYRDESIKRLKKDLTFSVYRKMAEELDQERVMRARLQESVIYLHRELIRYKKLVGDYKEEDVDN